MLAHSGGGAHSPRQVAKIGVQPVAGASAYVKDGINVRPCKDLAKFGV